MKEKKKKRRGLRAFIAILWVLLIALVVGYCVLLYVDGQTSPEKQEMMFFGSEESAVTLNDVAEEYAEVSYDEGDSVLYINNEIIVLADIDADLADIEDIAIKYGAEISDTMEDLGIYQLRLADSASLDALDELAAQIAEEEGIETAYVNPVIIFETDAEVDGTEVAVELPEPVYPEDPWDDVDWNIETPGGDNWGLEAINAPTAWGYLSELETSRVGLIDLMPHLDHEDITFTGAYYSFYDLEQKKWYDQEIDPSVYSPSSSHGTHVAGTMGAAWNDKGISGVLGNNSEVYYSRAYNVEGGSVVADYDTAYTFVKAISVLLEHDVTAINISMNTSRVRGFAASQGDKDAIESLEREADIASAMLERIIAERREAGRPDFVVCVAAGNSNGNYFMPDEDADYGYVMLDSYQRGSLRGGVNANYSEAKYNNFLNLIDNEEVAGRIIVVGAVGIDEDASAKKDTVYEYTYFSCTGERVDIAAPGDTIYSCVDEDGKSYAYYNGTSMATPHVTAAAGMLFASNPELSGPEVKKILVASASGRYYYDDGNCGLLDLANAVRMGIESRDSSVNRVIGAGGGGLDLCFLVDTTGSMSDDIENAKENMIYILETLGEKTDDYRVALVDYRDFADRTWDDGDYPAKTQLNFTNDKDSIINAINGLTLGNGGDYEETVYSGFAEVLTLDWRATSSKVIIVLGDAPPLDPEPETGYTYASIVEALYNADVMVDVDSSDDVALGDAEESLIKIYSIGTEAGSDAADFFESISSATGGSYTGVEDATGVSDAIVDSIEQIELEPVQTVKVSFGEEFSGEKVDLYYDGDYQFSFELDEDGDIKLEDMKIDSYEWEIDRLHRDGEFKVREGKSKATAEVNEGPWYSFVYVLWERQRNETFFYAGAGLLVLILFFTMINLILGIVDNSRRKKEEAAAAAAAAAAPQYPYPPYPYGMYPNGVPYQNMQYPNGYPMQQPVQQPVQPVQPQMQQPVQPVQPVQQSVQQPVAPVAETYFEPAPQPVAPIAHVEPTAPVEPDPVPVEPVQQPVEPDPVPAPAAEVNPEPVTPVVAFVPTEPAEEAPAETPVAEPADEPAPEVIAEVPVTEAPAEEAPVPVTEAPKKKFCHACGHQLDPDAKFCFNCGQKM